MSGQSGRRYPAISERGVVESKAASRLGGGCGDGEPGLAAACRACVLPPHVAPVSGGGLVVSWVVISWLCL